MFKPWIIQYSSWVTPNWLLTDLVSYYKCDTSWSFLDAHWSNDWTINWATFSSWWGILNSAYDFDWSNDYIWINWLLTSLSTNTSWSFSFWIKIPDVTPTNSDAMLSFWDTNGLNRIFFDIDTSGRIRLFCTANNTTQFFVRTNATPFTANTWHNVIVTHNWTTPEVFVDNTKPAQSILDNTNLTCWFNDLPLLDNCTIGALFWANISLEYFDWLFDEFWAWGNRVLDSDDRTALYNSGAALSYDNFTT